MSRLLPLLLLPSQLTVLKHLLSAKHFVDAVPTTVLQVRRKLGRGAWVAQAVKRLPSAQVMIPGSWDRAPHGAPCLAGSLLLPLPLPLPLLFPLLVLSHSFK